MFIPIRTIERIIMYRIILEQVSAKGTTHIFSRELAELAGNTAAQVRRDLMVVGYNGNPQKGYVVNELLSKIKELLEPEDGIAMVLVGVGNLGRAILGYFNRLRPKFNPVASFDTDPNKVGRIIAGCRCYHFNELLSIIKPNTVQIGIITVPETYAQRVTDVLVAAGIKGIVNFAPVPVLVPENVYLENMQIEMTFEKVAYFARLKNRGGN